MLGLLVQNQSHRAGTHLRGKLLRRIAHQTFFSGEMVSANPGAVQSDDELRRLCTVLDEHPNTREANAVRLQSLTGARLGEVLTSRKEDFDLHRGIWTKPSHQTKQKRTEHLPLSAQALILVTLIIETSDASSPFLFPGNKPGQPLREIKKFWSAVMRKAGIANYRRHDNRHTYASHLVSSGLSLEIVGRLLGHTTTTRTKRYTADRGEEPAFLACLQRIGAGEPVLVQCVRSGQGRIRVRWPPEAI